MKFYIIADIEGVATAVDFKETDRRKNDDYELLRNILTQEVNSMTNALIKMGANTIIVNDFHGDGRNILFEKLPEMVQLIRGDFRATSAIDFLDKSFDGVLFIGAHAAGNTLGIMPHTYSGLIDIFVNDYLVSEFDILASLFGEYNVPPLVVSGDYTVCEQSEYLCKKINTVVTKTAITGNSALCYHPKVIQKQIYEKTINAVKNIKEYEPIKFKKPMKIDMNLYYPGHLQNCLWIPGIKKKNMQSISFKSKNTHELLNILYGIVMLFPTK